MFWDGMCCCHIEALMCPKIFYCELSWQGRKTSILSKTFFSFKQFRDTQYCVCKSKRQFKADVQSAPPRYRDKTVGNFRARCLAKGGVRGFIRNGCQGRLALIGKILIDDQTQTFVIESYRETSCLQVFTFA